MPLSTYHTHTLTELGYAPPSPNAFLFFSKPASLTSRTSTPSHHLFSSRAFRQSAASSQRMPDSYPSHPASQPASPIRTGLAPGQSAASTNQPSSRHSPSLSRSLEGTPSWRPKRWDAMRRNDEERSQDGSDRSIADRERGHREKKQAFSGWCDTL